MTDELPHGARPIVWETPAELVERYPVRALLHPCVGCGQPSATPVCETCRETLEAMPHGNEPCPKPLRLRIEPEGAAGPHWLTLLALIGWLRGVVAPGIVGDHAA